MLIQTLITKPDVTVIDYGEGANPRWYLIGTQALRDYGAVRNSQWVPMLALQVGNAGWGGFFDVMVDVSSIKDLDLEMFACGFVLAVDVENARDKLAAWLMHYYSHRKDELSAAELPFAGAGRPLTDYVEELMERMRIALVELDSGRRHGRLPT